MGKSSLSLSNLSNMPKALNIKPASNIGRAKRRLKRKKLRKLRQKSIQEIVDKLQKDKYTSIQPWIENTSVVTIDSSVDESRVLTNSVENDIVINNDKNKEESVDETKPLNIKNLSPSNVKIDSKENKSTLVINDKTLTPTKIDVNVNVDEVDGAKEDDSVIIVESRPPKRKLSKIDWNNSNEPKLIRDQITNKYVRVVNKKISPVCSTPKPKKPKLNTSETVSFNDESFITIDLTGPSEVKDTSVIDLETEEDCSFVSATNLSMSDDSQVTILNNIGNKYRNKRNLKAGINALNVSQKAKLLNMIATNLFNGCQLPKNLLQSNVPRALPTADDTYIKEVVLSSSISRNSVGSNIYNPLKEKRTGLRIVIVDGSNVAMEHSKGRFFSVQGLKICIDYFVNRGHVVKAFVPRFRQRQGKCSDPVLLGNLERRGLVVFTPSREIQGRQIVPYDDRYIVQSAAELDGVIVSGDNFRDLLAENPRWRFVIENRLLQFTWVNNMIMFPRDPLGRNGPTLEQILKHNT